MNKRRILTALTTVVILIFLYGGSAIASNLYVDDDDPTCGGNSPCYSTIQDAIDDASAGDTVSVADGTYTGARNKFLDFLGNAITVQSENGPNNCIIDIEGFGEGFFITGGEGNDSVVSGFTITNGETGKNAIAISDSSPTIENCVITGNGNVGILCINSNPIITNCTITGNSGSGISSDENSSPTITDCTITGNTAEYGSGIGCSDATITNSIISGNTTTVWGGAIFCGNAIITGCTIAGNNGGGISFIDSSPTITDCTITGNSQRGIVGSGNAIITGCTISGNTTGSGGGGINIWGDYSPTITNCVISNNTADLDGGGIRILGNSSPIITNCTISNNTASQDGGGIYCGDNPSPTVTNSILWGDSPDEIYIAGGVITVTYSDIEGAWGGIGNIVADPLFVDPGNSDFHIQVDSLCIDAGTDTAPELPDEDFEGDPRIVGSAPDMGADEFPCAVNTYYRDVDGDGYGDPSNSLKNCTLPSGYVINNTDCDDGNVAINPGATEVMCDGIDQDCDGLSDDDKNTDGDPVSYCSGDCDDTDPNRYPGNTEVCDDGIDNDCDGDIDSADADCTGGDGGGGGTCFISTAAR